MSTSMRREKESLKEEKIIIIKTYKTCRSSQVAQSQI